MQYARRGHKCHDCTWTLLRDSPWKRWILLLPLLLHDGRIMVLSARRKLPYGIGGIVGADDGRRWSRELILGDDGTRRDVAYPEAVDLDGGRIFAAYYLTLEGGNRFGGSRFIGGSSFALK